MLSYRPALRQIASTSPTANPIELDARITETVFSFPTLEVHQHFQPGRWTQSVSKSPLSASRPLKSLCKWRRPLLGGDFAPLLPSIPRFPLATPPPPRPASPSGVELRQLKATMNYSNEGGWKFLIVLFLAAAFWSAARSYGIPPTSWLSSHGELCNEGARACVRAHA